VSLLLSLMFQLQNYVIQFVLEHGSQHDRSLIVAKLRGQMLNMARHKFASNVCEKALVTADAENRRILIDEIMLPKQDGVSPIVTMMKDQFASECTIKRVLCCMVLIVVVRLCVATGSVRFRRRAERGIDQQDSTTTGEYAQVLECL
jgi:Pumilio-family RNA binding repeat